MIKLGIKITLALLEVLVVSLSILGLVLSHSSDCGPVPAVSDDLQPMKAIRYRCYGSPEVLEVVDVGRPVPVDNEVLVEVHAASVNPLDWHYMRGSPYFMRLQAGIGAPNDSRIGVDFAGAGAAVGKNVEQFKPGDAVFGGSSGAFAEYVTIREDRGLAMKPDNVTFAQAASVPIAGITALQALRDYGKLEPGQKVLINGASGGVGTFAVQIARSLGAEVTGVCSTRNLQLVRSLGAEHVIDYKYEDYTDHAQQYDLIIDMVGNHSLLANRRVLTPAGRLVIVGGPAGDWLGPMASVLGALVVSPFVDQELDMIIAKLNQDDLKKLGELMQVGLVTPVIDRHYALSEVADAMQYSEEGHARGKIVIVVR